jgi:hypothetical protein
MRVRNLIGFLCSVSILASSEARAEDNTGVPDFTGTWGRNAFDVEPLPSGPKPVMNIQRLPNGLGDPNQLVGDHNNPILRPEASDIVKFQGDVSKSGNAFPDPSNHCSPYSPPFNFAMQLGLQMLQEKNQITILYNQDDQVRRVRMNAAHPAAVTPSAMGDSIGHYEGDMLVIDTVGVKVGPVTMVDRYGTPQSDAMHVVERYRLIGADEAKAAQESHEKKEGRVGGPGGAMPIDANYGKGLQLQFTVEDPKVFTMPWSAQVTYRRTRGEWAEQVCAENFFEYYSGKPASIPSAKTPDF